MSYFNLRIPCEGVGLKHLSGEKMYYAFTTSSTDVNSKLPAATILIPVKRYLTLFILESGSGLGNQYW
jgi:hypothetical protein